MSDIKNIIIDILGILENSDDKEWVHTFQYFLSNIEDNNIESIKNEIKTVYAGMGSFNDLIVYRNDQILINENNELDFLRKKLYTYL